MKVYKTKPNEHGWYIVARLRKDGYLDLQKRTINKKYEAHEQWIQIHIKDLKEILKELKAEEKEDKEELFEAEVTPQKGFVVTKKAEEKEDE